MHYDPEDSCADVDCDGNCDDEDADDGWFFITLPELTSEQALALLDSLDCVPGRRPKWDR